MVFSTYINRTLHTDSLNSVIWHHVGPIQCMHFKNYPTNSRMDPLQDLTLAEFLNLINLHEHYIYCNQPIPLIKVLKKKLLYINFLIPIHCSSSPYELVFYVGLTISQLSIQGHPCNMHL